MYPVSKQFIDALRASNQRVVTRIVTVDGTELDIKDGSVDMDSSRDIGRTCKLELTPTNQLNTAALYRLLRLPAQEIQVYRGLRYNVVNTTTGTTATKDELVPLGLFTTDNAKRGLDGSAISWSGSDRSKKVAKNRFLDPYQIAAGTSLAAAGASLLRSRLNNVAVDFANVTDTITSNVIFEAGSESDPWKSVRGLFADYGYDLRFDGLGTARAIPIPDPATQNVDFDFGSGETSLILGGEAEATSEKVYNGVIASAESTSAASPIRAEVWDTDQQSPTYYLSGFGKVPYFYSSALLTTAEQAQKAAATILARVKGRSQKLSWPALVNPALEPLDVVTTAIGSEAAKAVLDSIKIPLTSGGAMSAAARETTIANG